MNPKVSVVIPTYNRANKVRKGIESVLAQSRKDLEVIVVDDGSTDDTAQTLRHAYGDQIRYYFQPNQGVSVARNKGIEEANGDWIAFLDSDDAWEKEKLELQLDALEHFGSQCGACYTDVQFFNHSETRTMFQLAQDSYLHQGAMGVNTDVMRLLVKPGGAGMVVCLSSLVVRRDVVRKIGGFDPTLLYSQDSEFMFRLAMLTGFCFVNRALVQFDRSPAETRHVGVQSEWNKIEFWLRDSQLRLEGLLRVTQNQPAEIRNLVRRQLGGIHSGWVNCYLDNGEYGKARVAAFKAVRMTLTLNVGVKWLLTWISPRLALRIVRRREGERASAFTV
jgi:glycosyltransferase involved in cell wall biosynthesis